MLLPRTRVFNGVYLRMLQWVKNVFIVQKQPTSSVCFFDVFFDKIISVYNITFFYTGLIILVALLSYLHVWLMGMFLSRVFPLVIIGRDYTFQNTPLVTKKTPYHVLLHVV